MLWTTVPGASSWGLPRSNQTNLRNSERNNSTSANPKIHRTSYTAAHASGAQQARPDLTQGNHTNCP